MYHESKGVIWAVVSWMTESCFICIVTSIYHRLSCIWITIIWVSSFNIRKILVMTKIPNLQFYFTKFPIQLPGVLFEKFQNDPWCENKKIFSMNWLYWTQTVYKYFTSLNSQFSCQGSCLKSSRMIPDVKIKKFLYELTLLNTNCIWISGEQYRLK
jgi:hypothetical protein